MKSVDTSVLARAILNDHLQQAALARALLHTPVLVIPTVVLELFWVLTRVARQSRAEVAANLSDLMATPTIRFSDADAVRWALDAYRSGADFPDMLHLALSRGVSAFVTFDQGIGRFASEDVVPVETLIG